MSLNFDEFNSVVKIFEKQSSMLQDQPYLWRKIDDKYSLLTWKEVRSNVERFSTALKNLGILEGDRVVIVSENRPEWQIADLSIMAIGAISVPAYTTSTTNDYEYIIKHSGARCIIVSSHDLAKKVLPAVLSSPMCQTLIKINDDNENYDVPITVHSWNSLIKENRNSDFNLSEIIKNHSRKDTACIIYTSGTGGNPKGVMLSHGAMLTNCEGAKHLLNDIISTLNKVRVLSWLPLSHSYEHTLQFYKMGIGAQIYYAEGIDKLLVNMTEARPHIMTAVPRFYDSLHTRISQGLKKQSKVSQFFFKETLRLGKKIYFNEPLSFFEKKFNGLLNKIVRKKVNKRFGGSLKALVSGGAALNFEVGIYLSALGLPLLQGYGQTETAPVVSANPPHKIKLDTVGTILKGTKVKIADDGEILVSGENVMNGYWNDPKATSSTLINGWVHTGDIGEMDEEGYLKITDRKKDIIVNAGGDNISPSRIEEKFNIEPEIAQSMIYGDFKNYLVAILVPDRDYAQEWAKDHHKEFNLKILNQDPDFIKMIKETTERVNKKLSQIEQVRKYLLIDEEFTVENDMMTPTLKVRRFKVKEKYQSQLEALY
ncbi:MAG: long-chain fatty acid--CoA ligase [Pelagibacteraceae bacterium]|jgi:long-chain acyl-CoA synthetase|nr:long-chain fatty acid--CoA ligase [Pelagibacteraceae bacterium]MBO6470877.1 long-chain fatty acid--CoA ligase [Pelagibacteraceae bacterium]MDP6784214.1 long-chain fatty acid--CoA ligase [Alphaproteobacteria bacterium]